MSRKFDFENLVELCRRTHKEIGPTLSAQLASLASVDGTPAIRPTASDESIPLENTIVLLKDRFSFGWSHYVTLLTIDNPEERRFYELEAEAAEVQYL